MPPELRSIATALLHKVQAGLSHPPVELVYTSHDRWPLHPALHSQEPPVKVAVLDASFNPPTKAHLALANSHSPSSGENQESIETDYGARLLLLSVRNADKTLKPGDATFIQRIEMMSLLSQDVNPSAGSEHPNVAIAIIDEPTFVGKSRLLQTFFKSRLAALGTSSETQLTFLLGLDTLERFAAPRYYPSTQEMMSAFEKFFSPPPVGDGSHIVCARRTPSDAGSYGGSPKEDFAPLERYMISGINLINIEADFRSFSSSEVRNTVSQAGLESPGWKRFVTERVSDYIVNQRLYIPRDN